MTEDQEREAMPLVRLPGPVPLFVRQHFVRKVLRGVPDHTPAGITMGATMYEDGRPLWHFVFISDEGLEPLTDDQLGDIDLREVRDRVLAIEAQESTPDKGYTAAEAADAPAEEFASIIARDYEDAYRAARASRRHRQVTSELLAEVLRLYDAGGIDKVKDGVVCSQSYAYKLLARARAEAKAS
jgi:hypothetical protein